MTMETISGSEWCASDEQPFIDGDYIRNVLVLGRESKNAWNAGTTSAGDPNGPRRKFNQLLSSAEEVAKFGGRDAFMLHKPAPRNPVDNIGVFENPRASDKGLRMDLCCRKIEGSESFHPQAVALRDNVEHKRPFGGFSPRFDFTIDPSSGEVQTIIACESIDLVPQPASVRSAIESDLTQFATKAEVEAVQAKLDAFIAGTKVSGQESHVRSVPPPQSVAAQTTSAKSFAEFIRS